MMLLAVGRMVVPAHICARDTASCYEDHVLEVMHHYKNMMMNWNAFKKNPI
jgi:hypothetical protein